MATRKPSLDAEISFEDRTYEAGDTVHTTIQLNPSADRSVRRVTAYLVRNSSSTESSAFMGYKDINDAKFGATRGGFRVRGHMETKRMHDTETQTKVYGEVVLDEDRRLTRGMPVSLRTQFRIPADIPAIARDSKVTWVVSAGIDVVRGRDLEFEKQVRVTSPIEPTATPRPTLSKPKRPTRSR